MEWKAATAPNAVVLSQCCTSWFCRYNIKRQHWRAGSPKLLMKLPLRYHFSQNSWKLGSQKLLPHGHFWWGSKFFFFSLPSGPRGMFEPIVTNSDTSNTHKHPKTPKNAHKHPQRVVLPHFRERVDESPRQDENFVTFGLFLSFVVSELRLFKVKTNFSNVFLRLCSLIPLMHCS